MFMRACLAATLAAISVGNASPATAASAIPTAATSAPGALPAAQLSNDTLLARGITAFHKGDYAAASRDFRLLARREVPAAETLLGTMAANGQGSPPNDAVAAAWFLRAARRGYGPAQLALANAFAEGRGVARNLPRAQQLARAAAGQGQPGAAEFAARLTPQRYAQLTRPITGGRP
jgi:TPR repeat protein